MSKANFGQTGAVVGCQAGAALEHSIKAKKPLLRTDLRGQKCPGTVYNWLHFSKCIFLVREIWLAMINLLK